MSMGFGIALDLSRVAEGPADALALVLLAEQRNLELAVLTGDGAGGTSLDPWVVATWLAGATGRIGIAVAIADPPPPDPADPEAPYPAVTAKGVESLGFLAPSRILTDPADWLVSGPPTDLEAVADLADDGLPVAVPVRSAEDIERLAAYLSARYGDRPGPRRSAAARSKRAPAIDYEAVPPSLADAAVEPGDREYRSVSATYMRAGAPGLVLRARTPHEVADALAFARDHRPLPFGVRSGGHGISGRSTNDGGLVLDVRAMNTIEVLDEGSRTVRIGPGATWKQVAAALGPRGWALGSGDYGGVGVGGLATAGGIGLLSRNHGLTIDHLRAVDMVLADGSMVRASRDEHPDLFWAVRGAGANFGVMTSFEFQVDEVGDVGWAQLFLVTDDIEASLNRYGEIAGAAPNDTTAFLVTGRPQNGMSNLQLYIVVDNPDPDTVIERLTPFLDLGTLARQQVVMTPYAGVMSNAADVGPNGQHGMGEPHSRSAFLPALTPEFARDAAAMLRTGAVYFFELRAMGGAIADVSGDAAAFSHRDPAFQLSAMGGNNERLNLEWEPLRRHFDGLYLSFETDRTPQRLLDAFPPPVLGRLRELKLRYDPDNLFRDNFNIDPSLPAREFREALT